MIIDIQFQLNLNQIKMKLSFLCFCLPFVSASAHIRTDSDLHRLKLNSTQGEEAANGTDIASLITAENALNLLDSEALESAVGYVFGESAQNVIFHPDSPLQYAIHYDYTPLLNSLLTLVNFVSSESSPGYIIATFDYTSLMKRLAPEFLTGLTRRYAVTNYQGSIITTIGVVIFSSIVAFVVYLAILVITTITDIEPEARQQHTTGGFDRNDELVDKITVKVLEAIERENLQREQIQDHVFSWMNNKY